MKILSSISSCTPSLPYLLCLWTQSSSMPYCHRGLVRISRMCRRHQQNPPLFWSNSTLGSVYGLALFCLLSWKEEMRQKYSWHTFTKISFRRKQFLKKRSVFCTGWFSRVHLIYTVLWHFVVSFAVQLKADCNKGYVTVKQVRFYVWMYSISDTYWDSCCT